MKLRTQTSVLQKASLICTSFILVLLMIEGMMLLGTRIEEKYKRSSKNWVPVPERIWTEYHETLGWFNKPNHTATLEIPATHPTEIKINAQGFRSARHYSIEQNKRFDNRVILLGDSFTFGFGVTEEETFAKLLQKALPSMEFLNMSVVAYGIDQISLLYTHIAKPYHANVAVVIIYPENFWRATRAYADSGHSKPYFTLKKSGDLLLRNVPVPPPYTATGKQFPDLFEMNFWEQLRTNSRISKLLTKSVKSIQKRLGRTKKNYIDKEWILGSAILKDLLLKMQLQKTDPILAFLPPAHSLLSDPQTLNPFVQFAHENQVPFIDLTPALRTSAAKNGLDQVYIKDDWHLAPEGHRIVANVLQSYLEKKYAPQK